MFVVDYFQDCSDCEVEFWVFLSFQAGIEDRDSSSTIGDDVDDDELVRLLLADAEEESSIAAEEWSEKVAFKLDVGSVWAVFKTLRAYRVRPGLHRMNVRKGALCLKVRLTSQRSLLWKRYALLWLSFNVQILWSRCSCWVCPVMHSCNECLSRHWKTCLINAGHLTWMGIGCGVIPHMYTLSSWAWEV